MSAWKTVYAGEWVKAMPLVNRRFRVVDPACQNCRRASCGPAMISIRTKRVLCFRCFGQRYGAELYWLVTGRSMSEAVGSRSGGR